MVGPAVDEAARAVDGQDVLRPGHFAGAAFGMESYAHAPILSAAGGIIKWERGSAFTNGYDSRESKRVLLNPCGQGLCRAMRAHPARSSSGARANCPTHPPSYMISQKRLPVLPNQGEFDSAAPFPSTSRESNVSSHCCLKLATPPRSSLLGPRVRGPAGASASPSLGRGGRLSCLLK